MINYFRIESDEEEIVLRASFVEIYMELVKDLLAPDSLEEHESMRISVDSNGGLWL